MGLSTTFKNSILEGIVGKKQFTNEIWIALFNGDPQGGGTEVKASSYSRVLVGGYNKENKMGTPAEGSVSNTETIYFPEATESWGSVDYIGLYTAKTGGTLEGSAKITNDMGAPTPLEIDEGKVPLVRVGKFTLSFVDAE